MTAFGEYVEDVPSSTMKHRDYKDATDLVITPTLRSNGDAHSGFTTVEIPEIAGCLDSGGSGAKNAHGGAWPGTTVQSASAGHCFPVAYNLTFCDANGRRADRPNGGLYVNETDQASTLTRGEQSNQAGLSVLGQFGVRRITPTECERLQGFPDCWTAFGDDGKPTSDSARYRMLGNAVCVPTAQWIAERIFKILISSSKESS